MPEVILVPPSSYVSMPCSNGLGTTLQLMKQDLPAGDGFAWRLSIAAISGDGEFSDFSGYDRTLLLLEGNGLTLQTGGREYRLDEPLQAACFSGEAVTCAILHDGPVRDFNIMNRRDYCSTRVTSQAGAEPCRTDIDADLLLIYAVDGELTIDSSDFGQHRVPAQHLLIVDNPARQAIDSRGAAHIATQIQRIDNA